MPRRRWRRRRKCRCPRVRRMHRGSACSPSPSCRNWPKTPTSPIASSARPCCSNIRPTAAPGRHRCSRANWTPVCSAPTRATRSCSGPSSSRMARRRSAPGCCIASLLAASSPSCLRRCRRFPTPSAFWKCNPPRIWKAASSRSSSTRSRRSRSPIFPPMPMRGWRRSPSTTSSSWRARLRPRNLRRKPLWSIRFSTNWPQPRRPASTSSWSSPAKVPNSALR